MQPKHLWTAAFVTAGSAGLVLASAAQPSIWDSWRPATCLPDGCFCEAVRSQLVKQPANAVSGLAFVGVGLLVLFSAFTTSTRVASARHGHVMAHPVYPLLFALSAVLVGVGTTFYHASLTFWGQTVDILGMYLVATWLVVYNLSRWKALSPRAAAILYGAGNAVLIAGAILMPSARRYVFAALVLLAIGLEIAARRRESAARDARLFLVAAGALGFGFFIWILDITRTVCAPASWLQGHAIWHIAGAAALWLVFLYYKSE